LAEQIKKIAYLEAPRAKCSRNFQSIELLVNGDLCYLKLHAC